MKKICAVACLLFLAGFITRSSAQDILYSPLEKIDIRTMDFSVAGKIGDRLYTYQGSAEGYYLHAFNNNMERLATVILDFFPKKVTGTKFVLYSDRMLVLYQSPEGGKVTQYAALLDEKGRLLKGPMTVVAERNAFFGSGERAFYTAVSEDKKQVIVYGVGEDREELQVDVVRLDDQLGMQKKSVATFTAENNVSAGEGMVNNNGTFFMSAYTPIGNKGYADQVWMLSLENDAHKFVSKELPLSSMFASGTYMKMDNENNRIYIGGLYSDKKNGNCEGVMYSYYDIALGDYQLKKMIPFDERLRNATGERSLKRAFNDFKVRQLIVKNDGGFILIAEEYYITTRNSYAPGMGYYSWYYPSMSSAVREYHYNDIMAMSYDADGARDWTSFIRKGQYSQEDGGTFSSYALVNTGGSVGFLYNDFNSVRSRIQMGSVDGDGKINTRALVTNGNEGADWLPRYGKQVSAREIVIPCLQKKQICFAKVVF